MNTSTKIDWLTMTLPYAEHRMTAPQTDSEANLLMQRLRRNSMVIHDGNMQQIKRNEPHYHFHFVNSHGWQLSLSARQEQGLRLVMSGGVLPVGHVEQRYIYEHLRSENWRVTRLDVAHDIFNSGMEIEKEWHDGLSKQAFERKFRTDLILSPNGDTINIGARTSDKYLRIYDKGKEQRLSDDWKRYELEIKHKTARNLPTDYNSVIRGGLASMLGMCTYIRADIRDHMEVLSQGAESFTGGGRQARGNREIWLMTQVIPALHKTYHEDRRLFDLFVRELVSVVK